MINFYRIDNIEFMKTKPDKYYDLAIVDPPYGLDTKFKGGKTGKIQMNSIPLKGWDRKIPDKKYFDELFRVSKNQIIWGGNYFLDYLGNTRCFLIWDKIQKFSGSDFEMAWTSFTTASKAYRKSRVEFHNEDIKIHPTQKAVSLYEWIFKNYSVSGMKILDTHGGSMSIAIAADNYNVDLDICEIDKEYFDKGVQRYEWHKRQLKLF